MGGIGAAANISASCTTFVALSSHVDEMSADETSSGENPIQEK